MNMENGISDINKSGNDLKGSEAPPNCYKLPKEVYYRCLWVVRDAERLRNLVKAGEDYSPERIHEYKAVTEDVLRQAAADLGCVSRALLKIPEVYRYGIIDNITEKTTFGDYAHINTWKRWKQVFLYELARELHYI